MNAEVDGDVNTATELLNSTSIVAPGPVSRKVKAIVTQDLKHVLIQLSSHYSSTDHGQVFVLPVSELEPISASVDKSDVSLVRSAAVPEEIRSRVRIALAILPGDRFIFLDWDLWVNSYRLTASTLQSTSSAFSSKPLKPHSNEGSEIVQRHYFVPDDWAMCGSLDLCCMTADGTLIYPRDLT